MNHKVFIPVTDEMLYEHPELITAPLRPYQVDNPCFHWMATIESPEDSENEPRINMRFDHHTSLGEIRNMATPAITSAITSSVSHPPVSQSRSKTRSLVEVRV